MSLVTFTVDGLELKAEAGSPLIDAMRDNGLQVPSMCYERGHCAQNSCLTCVVKINHNPNIVPSCSRPVEEGMIVESDCEEVWDVRKTALELILSDHIGDCYSPCAAICPAHMEIPQMLRQVTAGDYRAAIKTVKRDIPFPSILGRVCPEVCEGGCRRGKYDTPEAICSIERFVGDQDLMSTTPYIPEMKVLSGKKVAIVGAGITGMTAAYYSLIEGHQPFVYESLKSAGGSLEEQFPEAELPRTIIKKEIDHLQSLGIHFHYEKTLGVDLKLSDLQSEYDAVIICTGKQIDYLESENFQLKNGKVACDSKTHQSHLKGVFLAGTMIHGKDRKVYSIASGKSVSIVVKQFLEGKPIVGREKRFNSISPVMNKTTIHTTLEKAVNQKDRYSTPESLGTVFSEKEKSGFEKTIAPLESSRCLHCDCRAKDACDLRDFSELVGANQKHYKGVNRGFTPLDQVDHIHLDSGKCLQCGLCVQLSKDGGEPLGLTYEGRGFYTKIVVPFGRKLSDALTHTAKACADACPTGAISFKEEAPTYNNPYDKNEPS